MNPLRLLLLSALLLAPAAFPCTAFELGSSEHRVMGKSYDWSFGDGQLVVNARGVVKRGVGLVPGDAPASWTSRFGSVTFNQYGRELPNGGLNEAGLALEVLWLNESQYPKKDERPSLNELQLVQYLLDTSGTVAEALDQARRVRVAPVHGAVHYFACDASGACGTLEFLGGELVTTTGSALAAKVLTNSTAAESGAAWRALEKAGGKVPGGGSSLARSLRASSLVKAPSAAPVRDAFLVLDSVSLGAHSKWNIVYELDAKRVHFRTSDRTAVKTLSLSGLDFACGAETKVLDLATTLEGDVTAKLEPYRPAANEALVRKSLALTRVKLSEEAVLGLAHFPERLACAAR